MFILLLTACQKEYKSVTPNDGIITFSSTNATKATTAWKHGDKIGVSMVRQSTPGIWGDVVDGMFNRSYQTTGDGVFRPSSVADVIKSPYDKEAATFIAYYPFQEALHSAKEDLYPINTTEQSSPEKIDLMVARNLKNITIDNTVHNLIFEHVNSKIKINISSEFQESTLVGASVSIKGIEYESGNYRLLNEVEPLTDLRPSSAELSAKVTADGKTAEAIVLASPNFLSPGELFTFTLKNGRKLKYISDTRIELLAGRQYVFNIALKANGKAELLTDVAINTAWDGTPLTINVDGSDVETDQMPGSELEGIDKTIYYHRSLLSEQGKKLYDIMVTSAMKFEAQASLELHTYTIPEHINVTTEEFATIREIILDDQPIMFQCQAVMAGSSYGGIIRSYRLRYSRSRTIYERQYRQTLLGADRVMGAMPSGLSEYERVRYVHDHFLDLVSYGMSKSDYANIFGALGNFLVVCEGYANGLQYLLYRAGIQAIYISGRVDMGNGVKDALHAWCIVRIDGQYYQIDPTWNDPSRPGVPYHHKYFLKSDATMNIDHEIKPNYPRCNRDYPLP